MKPEDIPKSFLFKANFDKVSEAVDESEYK